MLSKRQNDILNTVSKKLNINPKHLKILINFESKFNPKAKNPNSSARGLIQFTNNTAQKLGYKNSLDLINKNPTIESQLINPVYRYLNNLKPFKNANDLFLSVFYPAYRNKPINKKFPKIVRCYNPGINTPKDYIKKIYSSSRLKYVNPLLYFVGVSTILFIIYNNKKGENKYGKTIKSGKRKTQNKTQ